MGKTGNVLIGSKTTLFPASGVQTDVEALLREFVETETIRFEEFSRIWRQSNFSLIHCGRRGLREKREFVEESFKVIFQFALPPYSLQVRVGAIYTLYGFYHTQRAKPKVRVRIPLSCYRDIDELHKDMIENRHLDVDYVIRKMKRDAVFEYVAYPSQLTLDHVYNCEEPEDLTSSAESPGGNNSDQGIEQSADKPLEGAILDDDALSQLKAVHEKYHKLKCQSNQLGGGDPGKPCSSLDFIQSDLVEKLIATKREKAAPTAPADPEKLETSDASLGQTSRAPSERANRISEIKKRALSAKATSKSGALRYIAGEGSSPPRDATPRGRGIPATSSKKTPRRKGRRKQKLSSSESGDARSDYDDTGVSVPEMEKVPRPSRKSKQAANMKLNETIDDVTDDESDSTEAILNESGKASEKETHVAIKTEGKEHDQDDHSQQNKDGTEPPERAFIELENDSFIALKSPKSKRQRPLVAKVVEFDDTHVVVRPFAGDYLTKWVEQAGKKVKRLPRDQVIMAGFQLTGNKKLPIKVMRDLRKLYEELD